MTVTHKSNPYTSWMNALTVSCPGRISASDEAGACKAHDEDVKPSNKISQHEQRR